MSEILTMILGITGAILTALVSWAAQRLIMFLNRKIQCAKSQQIKSQAADMVSSVVKQVYQTYVDGLKGTEDWTENAKNKALCSAVDKCKLLLTNEMSCHIKEAYGNIDTWLDAAIEAKIYDLKQEIQR